MVAAADSCRGDRVGSISFDRVALSLHPARILWAKATGCRLFQLEEVRELWASLPKGLQLLDAASFSSSRRFYFFFMLASMNGVDSIGND